MKKITFLVLMICISLKGVCQNKITGTIDLPSFSVRNFDKISFEVSYQVVDDRGTIRVNLSNPKIFIHPDSKYQYNGKFYTRQELGLASWPQTQSPSGFGVLLNVQYPGGSVNHMFRCTESGTCEDNNDYILRSVDNKNNYKPAAFRVSFGGQMYNNCQGSDQVERMIKSLGNTGQGRASNPVNPAAGNTARNYNPRPANGGVTNQPDNSSTDYANKKYLIDPASIGASNKSTEQLAEQVGAIANGLLDLFGGKKNTRVDEQAIFDREEAAETAAAQKRADAAAAAEAERVRLEAARVAREALISSRISVINPYRTGSISRTIASNVKTLYYFYSSYQPSSLTANSFELYISNVFEVRPYGDGTWPYTEQLVSDLAKIKQGHTIALSGGYSTLQSAEEQLAMLKQSAANNGFSILETKFAGKNTGNGQADFWGTPAKTTATPAQQKAESDQDYWGAPVAAPAKIRVDKPGVAPPKRPATKTTTPKKTDATPKKVEVDYWGNPVKN